MAEPTRKKNKANGTSNVRSLPQITNESSLVFLTSHKTNPCRVDLTEFRDGGKAPIGLGRHGWGGDFSGRPLLIEQLLPHIRSIYLSQTEGSIRRGLITALRTYWRLFDACDALPNDQRPRPVEGVADLSDIHDRLQVRLRINGNLTRAFLRLVDAARKDSELHQMDWKPNETGGGKVRVSLDLTQTRAIYHTVKSQVRQIYTSWENDATLVPSRRDSLYIMTFVLIKTGWNEAVALNIDANDYLRPHMSDPDRHVLHSTKVRSGGTEQVHVGRNKEEWSPGNLIKKVIERSEALREPIRKQREELQIKTKGRRLTDEQIMQLSLLDRTIRSPWLHATRPGIHKIVDFDPSDSTWTIKVLTPFDCTQRSFPGNIDIITFLQGKANSVLVNQGHPRIEKITLSDVRDAYINWAYSSTGYEWMMAKLAAGHTSIQSAIAYLRTRALKQHGETAVRQLTTIVFDEIKTQKRLDPIFLYARVNRGQVSVEQRERWARGKDRTRVGTGCVDFKHPPLHIAPHHQSGKGCRTQRCTLCDHAIVFSDSYRYLARRKEELLTYQETIGMMIWATTDFPDELRKVEHTLSSYDPMLVNLSLAHWREEIKAGRHTPPTFEGSYE